MDSDNGLKVWSYSSMIMIYSPFNLSLSQIRWIGISQETATKLLSMILWAKVINGEQNLRLEISLMLMIQPKSGTLQLLYQKKSEILIEEIFLFSELGLDYMDQKEIKLTRINSHILGGQKLLMNLFHAIIQGSRNISLLLKMIKV